jgi:hypothetical protein
MKKICFVLMIVMLTCPAVAQEVYVNGGITHDTKTSTAAGQWSVTHIQGFMKYGAFSFSYINEGHQPNHFRDGIAAEVWGHTTILNSPLSIALGIGPYVYFDTKVSPETGGYENLHGLGIISSATATWYGWSPFLLQARLNYILTNNSFDTLSATLGIGYLLEVPVSPGIQPKPAKSRRTTDNDNEITILFGKAILNSDKSEKNTAYSIEYRRGLWKYVDWTIAWLSEGDNSPIGRYGVTTQLWLTYPILLDGLEFGIGAGPYLAYDKYSDSAGSEMIVAGDVSAMAAYWFNPHIALRATWSRIITDNHRDTDVFLGGLAYRF